MFCSKCGTPIVEGTAFCAKCGTPVKPSGAQPSSGAPAGAASTPGAGSGTMRGAPGASGAASTTAPAIATGKSPTVALILSVFLGALGVGQFYNGDWKKGLAMAAGSILLSVPTAGVAPFGVWIWSMIDAWQVASGKWSKW